MKRKHTIGISSFAIFEELYLRYYNVDEVKNNECVYQLWGQIFRHLRFSRKCREFEPFCNPNGKLQLSCQNLDFGINVPFCPKLASTNSILLVQI